MNAGLTWVSRVRVRAARSSQGVLEGMTHRLRLAHQAAHPRGKEGRVVYDLRGDPGELHNLIASKEHAPRVERLRGLLKQTAARAGDPIADYIAKLFGDWENLSGQFEAAAPVTGRPAR